MVDTLTFDVFERSCGDPWETEFIGISKSLNGQFRDIGGIIKITTIYTLRDYRLPVSTHGRSVSRAHVWSCEPDLIRKPSSRVPFPIYHLLPGGKGGAVGQVKQHLTSSGRRDSCSKYKSVQRKDASKGGKKRFFYSFVLLFLAFILLDRTYFWPMIQIYDAYVTTISLAFTVFCICYILYILLCFNNL